MSSQGILKNSFETANLFTKYGCFCTSRVLFLDLCITLQLCKKMRFVIDSIFKISEQNFIVEAAPRDKIWGVGMGKTNEDIKIPANWKGTNILGWALMEARKELQAERS